MSDTKKSLPLDALRSKMPRNYASLIAEIIKDEAIDNEAVRRVFRGQTTEADTVIKVLEAANTVVEKHQRIKTLQNDLANKLA